MKTLNILHVLGQRPEKTGSGIYLRAVINQAEVKGHNNYLIAGVPKHRIPDLPEISSNRCFYVCFETNALNFPVTGMSDVMPYTSSLFRDLKNGRWTAYINAFTKVLEKTVQTVKPDIIHSHHLLVVTALIKKLFPDIPVVTTCHGTDLRQYNNCEHLRGFVNTHVRQVDRIMALTHEQKDEIASVHGIQKANIVVTGGGYDASIFNQTPKTASDTIHMLYAGKFNRSKGVHWLLKTLLKIRHLDWHLHMAGSGKGPEYDTCMELAGQLEQKVTVHGFVDHLTLSGLMKKCHIQVLPSFFEGLPLVLFEGLASGCRIITTCLTGYNEIFGKADPDTVRLIQLPELETIDRPYKKDEATLEQLLIKAFIEMIESARTEPDYKDTQAEKIARSFTWEQVFSRIETVYKDVLN